MVVESWLILETLQKSSCTELAFPDLFIYGKTERPQISQTKVDPALYHFQSYPKKALYMAMWTSHVEINQTEQIAVLYRVLWTRTSGFSAVCTLRTYFSVGISSVSRTSLHHLHPPRRESWAPYIPFKEKRVVEFFFVQPWYPGPGMLAWSVWLMEMRDASSP